jgi:hypothetical protein
VDNTLEIVVRQLPNFVGLLFTIYVLWRHSERQSAHIDRLMNKCLDHSDNVPGAPEPDDA